VNSFNNPRNNLNRFPYVIGSLLGEGDGVGVWDDGWFAWLRKLEILENKSVVVAGHWILELRALICCYL
jgi:hypothetical protein